MRRNLRMYRIFELLILTPRFTSADWYRTCWWWISEETSLLLLGDMLQKFVLLSRHIYLLRDRWSREAEQRLRMGQRGNLFVLRTWLLDHESFSKHVKIYSGISAVPADLYRRWKAGEDVTPELREVYEQAILRGSVAIRSSAVYSKTVKIPLVLVYMKPFLLKASRDNRRW